MTFSFALLKSDIGLQTEDGCIGFGVSVLGALELGFDRQGWAYFVVEYLSHEKIQIPASRPVGVGIAFAFVVHKRNGDRQGEILGNERDFRIEIKINNIRLAVIAKIFIGLVTQGRIQAHELPEPQVQCQRGVQVGGKIDRFGLAQV